MKKMIPVLVLVAFGGTGAAFAATRTWHPTKKGSENRYWWTEAANWLDEEGNTGVPQDGDDVVFVSSTEAWGGASAKLNSFTVAGGASGGFVNQTTIRFPGGCEGFRFTGTGSSVSWYSVMELWGDGDVPFDVPAGKTFTIQKAYTQGGTAGTDYTTGATLVKKGGGTMSLGYDSWTHQCSYKRTRLEDGTLSFRFGGTGGVAGPKDFFPDNHDFMFGGDGSAGRLSLSVLDLRMKNVKFYEGPDVMFPEHGITCDSRTNVYLRFTGTPQLTSTVFSGKLYSSAGISWETEDAAREFVFSNAVSSTTGGLIVSNGTMRLTSGASFLSLSNVTLAAGATFKVEAGAGSGFCSKLLDLENATAEVHVGADVLLSFGTVRVGGVPLADGFYAAGDAALPWLKGTGAINVGAVSLISEDAVYWERTDGPTELAANTFTNYLGARFSGNAMSLTAGDGARAFIGTGGFTTAGDGATYTWGWPTVLEGIQTWDVPTGDTLTFTKDMITLPGAIARKEGAGTIRFEGRQTFNNDMIISNGWVEAVGDDSLGGPGGTTTFVITREGSVASGAPRLGKLRILPEPGKNEVSFHRPITFCYHYCDNLGNLITLPANTTVNFYGLMQTTLASPYGSPNPWPCHWFIKCEPTTTVHWRGGMYARLDHRFSNGHHYIHKALTGGDRLTVNENAVVELLVPGNTIGAATGNCSGNSFIYTRAPYALDGRSKNQLLSFAGATTLDLCGYDQALTIVHGSDPNARFAQITSAAPAFMRVVGNQLVNSSVNHSCTNYVRWTGAAGLSMERTATTYPVVLMSESSTTGTLQVVSGRAVMHAPNGSWTNATDVVMKGGELEVEHSAAFGTNTVVRFVKTGSAYGKINLFAGVKLPVAALEVDGDKQKMGLYGSSSSAAEYVRDDLFMGAGVLRVGEPIGLMIIIR